MGVLCSRKSFSLSWSLLHLQFPWGVELFPISLAYSNNSSDLILDVTPYKKLSLIHKFGSPTPQ